MGANSRKRKAARQRTQERNEQPGDGPTRAGESWDAARAYAVVEAHVNHALRLLARKKLSDDEVARVAGQLVARAAPHPRHVVEIVLHDLTQVVVGHVVDGGWSPSDLGELVARNLGPAHLTLLAAALREHERSSARAQAWRDAVDALDEPVFALGPGEPVATLLGLVALLNVAPRLTNAIADTAAERTGAPEARPVRALLAKPGPPIRPGGRGVVGRGAELISRYALDRLLEDRPQAAQRSAGAAPLARRAVRPGRPAGLGRGLATVHAATRAAGFSVVVGSSADLDAGRAAGDLPLLVQADADVAPPVSRTSASGTTQPSPPASPSSPPTPSPHRPQTPGSTGQHRGPHALPVPTYYPVLPVAGGEDSGREFLRLVWRGVSGAERERQRGWTARSRAASDTGGSGSNRTPRPRR